MDNVGPIMSDREKARGASAKEILKEALSTTGKLLMPHSDWHKQSHILLFLCSVCSQCKNLSHVSHVATLLKNNN